MTWNGIQSVLRYKNQEIDQLYEEVCFEIDRNIYKELEKERSKFLNSKFYSYDNKSRFKFLGKGGYSHVFLDVDNKVVLKMIKNQKIESQTSMNTMINEMGIGAYYHYTRTSLGTILSCSIDFEEEPEKLVFELDFLNGQTFGDLDYEKDLYTIFYRIKNLISLVADLRSIGLFHRDLKGGNIYVIDDKTSFDQSKFVLIDFAFSTMFNYDQTYKGTRKFMPDEFFKANKKAYPYNYTVDVFSIGVTILDYLLYAFNRGVQMDFGFMMIIESMLEYNFCLIEDKTGPYCYNQELQFNSFLDLEQIQEFYENNNDQTCQKGTQNTHQHSQKEYLCFQLDSQQKQKIRYCRIDQITARNLINAYFKFVTGETIDTNLFNFFNNNSQLFDLNKFKDPGFIGYYYNAEFQNIYRILESRKFFQYESEN